MNAPIVIVYKKERGRKHYLKIFKGYMTIDRIIAQKSRIIPRDCIIEEIGIGSNLSKIYKKKYKIK